MVREAIEQASREELIELALSTHAAHQAAARTAEQEKSRAEQEKARRLEAERQLAWFKKQLFGTKSEKRPGPIAEVDQLSLGEAMQGESRPVEKTLTVKAHARVISKAPESKNEPALRFDDSVPKTRRVILPPEVAGLDESQYEVIDQRITPRLVRKAQTRISRSAHKSRGAAELINYIVGQIVGSMNHVKSVRTVMQELVSEYADTLERLEEWSGKD